MKNILIVDDDHADYLFIKDELEEAFPLLKLDYSSSFENALFYIETNPDIDFLILDYDLGSKKGDELFKKISAKKKIPTLFITGNSSELVLDSIKNLDILGVLQKDKLKIDDISKFFTQESVSS